MTQRPQTTDAREARLAAVIGHPVAHSLSPRVFAFLSRELERPVSYEAIDVKPEDLASLVEAEQRAGRYTGWNVTLPHKKAVLKLASRASPQARRVGAANVLHFTPDGAEAHNTDVFGVTMTLQEQRFKPTLGAVLILGAGGAARAVACAAAWAGAQTVLVWNRTPDSALTLCADMTELFPNTLFRAVQEAPEVDQPLSLLVNATSVGLAGIEGELPCPKVAAGGLAFDVVYAAEPTRFLREAARLGARTVDGLDMLLWQAMATWELWFGPIAKKGDVKRSLKEGLREKP
ncbi:MAG: shikimate dehydrogenase [Deltaproteobacteria bacterium]|nr:shikimate dehydrogenase [Deltaproteobacteria bacterium]